MFGLLVSLVLVFMVLLVIGGIGWFLGSKRGYAKAQKMCQKLMREERLSWDEESRRLRESAAQEIRSLNQERETLRQENARLRAQLSHQPVL